MREKFPCGRSLNFSSWIFSYLSSTSFAGASVKMCPSQPEVEWDTPRHLSPVHGKHSNTLLLDGQGHETGSYDTRILHARHMGHTLVKTPIGSTGVMWIWHLRWLSAISSQLVTPASCTFYLESSEFLHGIFCINHVRSPSLSNCLFTGLWLPKGVKNCDLVFIHHVVKFLSGLDKTSECFYIKLQDPTEQIL